MGNILEKNSFPLAFVEVADRSPLGHARILKQLVEPFDFVMEWRFPSYLTEERQQLYVGLIQKLVEQPVEGVSGFICVERDPVEGFCSGPQARVYQYYYNFSLAEYVKKVSGHVVFSEQEVWYVVATLLRAYSALEQLGVPFEYCGLDEVFVDTEGQVCMYPFTVLFGGVSQFKLKYQSAELSLGVLALSLMYPEAEFSKMNPGSPQAILRRMEGFGTVTPYSQALTSFVAALVKSQPLDKEHAWNQILNSFETATMLKHLFPFQSMMKEEEEEPAPIKLQSEERLRAWHNSNYKHRY